MWVKICGTTSLADAQLAVDAGADAIGFVFAPSKRHMDAEQVAQITPSLPASVEKIGVFHSADTTEITSAASLAGLTGLQLHFRYDPNVIGSLRSNLGGQIKLLQVISCSVELFDEVGFRDELTAAVNDPHLWGILLDTSTKGLSGGTGLSFDWQRAASIITDVLSKRFDDHRPELVLAGGLRPENVREAITQLQPYGVDVVSGVEAAPGVKDPGRLFAFVEAAKSNGNTDYEAR